MYLIVNTHCECPEGSSFVQSWAWKMIEVAVARRTTTILFTRQP